MNIEHIVRFTRPP